MAGLLIISSGISKFTLRKYSKWAMSVLNRCAVGVHCLTVAGTKMFLLTTGHLDHMNVTLGCTIDKLISTPTFTMRGKV